MFSHLSDLSVLLSHFGAPDVGYADGDFNADGLVDLRDLAAFLSVFGSACP